MGHWTAQLHYWLTCTFPFPNSNKCHTNSFEQVYTHLHAAAWGFWKWVICCKRQEPRQVTSDLPSFLTVKILLYTVTVLVLLVILLLIQWNACWQTIHVTNQHFWELFFHHPTLHIYISLYGKSIHGEGCWGSCFCVCVWFCCCYCWLCRSFPSFFKCFLMKL